MALKDWEKQREFKKIITWTNQVYGKRNELCEIYKTEKGWKFIKIIGTEKTIDKNFKTKSQALAYARSYMRTH